MSLFCFFSGFMVHWKRRRKEGGTKTGILFQRSDGDWGDGTCTCYTHVHSVYVPTYKYVHGWASWYWRGRENVHCMYHIFFRWRRFPDLPTSNFSRFAPKFRLMSIAPTRVPNRSSASSHPYPTGQWPNLADFARPSYLFPYLPILSLLLLVRPTVFSQRPNTFFPTPTPTPTLTHPLSRTSTTDPDCRKSLSNTPRSTLCLPHRSLSRSIS